MIRLVDTHCHLDFSVFDVDRSRILQNCKNQSVQAIIVPGVNAGGWNTLLQLCRQEAVLKPALGLHPCFLSRHHPDDLNSLERFCQRRELLAVGEIGLDYRGQKCQQGIRSDHNQSSSQSRDNQTNLEQQRFYFSRQLSLAQQYRLPVLIHAVKSHHDVLSLLKQNIGLKGIIHAYSGSYEQALEYLKLGFKLGFGGAYSYPKATKLRALVSRLPLSAWVLETDAPDMSPESHSRQRNSPEYLPEIAGVLVSLYDKLASPELKHEQLTYEQILEQLYKNTLSIFPELES